MKNTVWDNAFRSSREIWGEQPSETVRIFERSFIPSTKTILVIGAGYGRNAKYFADRGYVVDALEFSDEAVQLGRKFAPNVNFIECSVFDFTSPKTYDAVYCHSFIHLFKSAERALILDKIAECTHENSVVFLSACTKEHKPYGSGKLVETETYESENGLILHFYDEAQFKNIDSRFTLISFGKLNEEYPFYYGISKLKSITA